MILLLLGREEGGGRKVMLCNHIVFLWTLILTN